MWCATRRMRWLGMRKFRRRNRTADTIPTSAACFSFLNQRCSNALVPCEIRHLQPMPFISRRRLADCRGRITPEKQSCCFELQSCKKASFDYWRDCFLSSALPSHFHITKLFNWTQLDTNLPICGRLDFLNPSSWLLPQTRLLVPSRPCRRTLPHL